MNTYWDSFDCQIQCDELIPEEYLDWQMEYYKWQCEQEGV